MDSSSKIVVDTDGASAKRPRGRPRGDLTSRERSRKNSEAYRERKRQLESGIHSTIKTTLLTAINGAIAVLRDESQSNEGARIEALNILEHYGAQWDRHAAELGQHTLQSAQELPSEHRII